MTTLSTVNTEDAYQVLCRRLGESADPETRAAWTALQEGIAAGQDLPLAWQRLTASQAARRADWQDRRFTDAVAKRWGPAPDGHDSIGRQYWYPATVDEWVRTHPPTESARR